MKEGRTKYTAPTIENLELNVVSKKLKTVKPWGTMIDLLGMFGSIFLVYRGLKYIFGYNTQVYESVVRTVWKQDSILGILLCLLAVMLPVLMAKLNKMRVYELEPMVDSKPLGRTILIAGTNHDPVIAHLHFSDLEELEESNEEEG